MNLTAEVWQYGQSAAMAGSRLCMGVIFGFSSRARAFNAAVQSTLRGAQCHQRLVDSGRL